MPSGRMNCRDTWNASGSNPAISMPPVISRSPITCRYSPSAVNDFRFETLSPPIALVTSASTACAFAGSPLAGAACAAGSAGACATATLVAATLTNAAIAAVLMIWCCIRVPVPLLANVALWPFRPTPLPLGSNPLDDPTGHSMVKWRQKDC